MGYTKQYSLKSFDYSNDWREDELVYELHEGVSVTIATNTGSVEVPTDLDEVIGMQDLCFLNATLTGTNQSIKVLTDGVITTGAVTVAVNTLNIGDGAILLNLYLIGKKKRVDL